MRDRDVRLALHAHLEGLHADDRSDTLLVDELGLCGEVRVDVAVVNGALSGFELKSASDTLRRFPSQVATYSRVLDYAMLVVAENHADKALSLMPEWWGYFVAGWDGTTVSLSEERAARRNPGVDAESLAQLLWRDEALAILEQRGAARGVRSKPRAAIWSRLAEALELDDLRSEVRKHLKGRQGWRVHR